MNRCSKTGLTDKNFKTVLDVLNMYDPKPWPQSIRYLHQNFAPGGRAAKHEAAVRKRWGYPDPISAA